MELRQIEAAGRGTLGQSEGVGSRLLRLATRDQSCGDPARVPWYIYMIGEAAELHPTGQALIRSN